MEFCSRNLDINSACCVYIYVRRFIHTYINKSVGRYR